MTEMQTLNKIIPGMKTGNGIFNAIISPMWAEDFDASQLDIYFSANYGHKFASYYAESFIDDDTGIIAGDDLTGLANAIYSMRSKEWAQLYAVLSAEYDPMENTAVTETVTETRTGSGLNGNTKTLGTTTTTSGTSSTTATGSISSEGEDTATSQTVIDRTESGTNAGNNASNVFGFDSVSAVGDTTGTNSATDSRDIDDTTTTNSSGTNSTDTSSTTTTSATTSGSSSDTGTITDSGTNSFSETFNRSYSKHGNIGVMSNVQLLSESVEFYKWSFIRQICEDICQFIALSVY